MFYKFYKIKYQGELTDSDIAEGFKKIYEENGVQNIGMWVNKDDNSEAYYINGYRDEEHFQQFVESMKTNNEYQALSKKLEQNQRSVETVTLIDYMEAAK